jgi:hypothetical protein
MSELKVRTIPTCLTRQEVEDFTLSPSVRFHEMFSGLEFGRPRPQPIVGIVVLVPRFSISRRLLEPNDCARKESTLNGMIIRTSFGFLEVVAGELADEQGMPLIQVERAGLEMLRLRCRR